MQLALATDGGLLVTILASMVTGLGLSALIAPASTVVMNDLPASKAGDGSSLNIVSRFVGAAMGVALVGSVFASVYTSQLSQSAGPLPRAQAAAAESSISGALDVAGQLPPGPAAQLADTARDAFDAAAAAGYWVIAALALLAAARAWWALRDTG